MKICIVTNSHHTTDVRMYYKIARSLAKLGEVYLISTSGVRNEAENPYQLIADAESSWFALFLLYQKAKKIKPDIVICVEPLTLFIGFALRRRFKTKVVFDVHEFFADAFAEKTKPPFSWYLKGMYLLFERWLQHRTDATIGVGDEILDQLVKGKKRSEAVTIPNYPVKNVWDYTCDMPRDLSHLCEMEFDLVYAGGLTRDRGVFKMLKAAYLLKQEFPHLRVLVVGKFFDPALEKEFLDRINALNLTAIVYYQKWLPAEKIGLLLKRSKVGLWLFNPQNTRMRKAVPLKVLEYFAAGLPVVSINTPLMNDLIEKNKVGFCCEYHSEAICKTVGTLLRLNAEDYDKMSKHAEELIEKKYNWEAVEPKLLDLMRRLASR
jgi:glycosyltransferase involved in cell wall biosynthesis